MSGPITVRNLTAQPLTITHIERYEAPQERRGSAGLGALTKNFTTLMSNATGGETDPRTPTRQELSEKAQSYAQQDIDIRLEPFASHKSDINLFERGPGDVVRLTLQGDGGGKWRIDVPTRSAAAEKLTPLTPDPKHDYSGIFVTRDCFLAIIEDCNLRVWMKEFKDDTSLAALSIPGTHNSPTCYKALPSVRCQAVPPKEQLENGVRFFDIRVQPANPDDPKSDELNLVHGVFPISLTGPKKFRGLVKEVREFLDQNPSETVVISLKREGPGNATDQQLGAIIRDHYTAGDTNKWYTEPKVPHLGQVRGKIVLMRRFALDDRLKREWDGRGWCLNAENWAYNTPDCTYGDVRVQDFCEVLETENIEKKIGLCCDHFERAGGVICPPSFENVGPLFLNFLSASNFWKVGCWPDKIAAKLNPAVTSFMIQKHEIGGDKGDGGTGIVVCDWVGKDGDWDLVRTIVNMNSKLLLKQRGIGWR